MKNATCQYRAFPPLSPIAKQHAQLYEGMEPMEEADRLREEGALDYLQYRWVGAVLCRGIERLKRPVVWSTLVKIDAGPRRARA